MFSRLVPGPLVRWFARPYVAGDSLDAALELADKNRRERGVRTTLDLLGEGVLEPHQVEATLKTYRDMIARLSTDPRFTDERPTISVKPSAFTTTAQDEARPRLLEIAQAAHDAGVALTIDMEDRPWTDFTLDLCTELFAQGFDVGIVLQSRLHRTQQDLARIPAGMRCRLVIGIYPEPAEVALTDKHAMKERMLDYAAELLTRGVFVEFATHDIAFVERFARDVAPTAPDRCEVQMLLGVPRREFQKKLTDGDFGPKLPVRLYVPFATSWDDATAYLRRRMKESPSVMWLVLRNFLSRKKR